VILVENRDFSYFTCVRGGGVPVSYPMVKNIVIRPRPTRFDTIQERVRKQDIHTDGQTGTGRDIQGAAKKRSRLFKCSLDHAKKSYLSANAIFGKVGRVASEEVTLQLNKSKCIPVLLYGLEACPLNKSDLHSLDFVIKTFHEII